MPIYRDPDAKRIEIFARDVNTRLWRRIDDLYWFEENGFHWFDDENPFAPSVQFIIRIDGKQVYPPENDVYLSRS